MDSRAAEVSSEITPEPELTARALLLGVGLGALLCVGNLYLGLKTGFWDSGSITASVLGFALLSLWPGRRAGALETNIVQTVAAGAGAMPAACGLLGAIPALALLGGPAPSAVTLALYGIALSALGILIALALRRRLIVEERLPFPTGVATAEVLRALHAGEERSGGRTWALLASAGVAALVAVLRDGTHQLLPGALLLPAALFGGAAATLSLGVAVSPILLGVGVVTGLRTGASALLGAVLGWGLLGPRLLPAGLIAQTSFAEVAAWLTWPGVALLVGASAVAIVEHAGTFAGALRDLRAVRGEARGGDLRAGAALFVAASAVVVAVSHFAFGLHPLPALLAIALSLVLAGVAARAAGSTDIAPLSQLGQMTQLASGAVLPAQAALNIAAGNIVAGEAAQTAVTLWSLRAGHILGASAKRQGLAAMVGALAGSLLAAPAYALLVRAWGLSSEKLPAPSAAQWRAVSEMVVHGTSALPPGGSAAVLAGAGLGVLLALLARRPRLARFLPDPVGMGIGMLVPASYSAAMCLGGLLLVALRRWRPQLAERYGPVLGAGVIAGESVAGLILALLIALSSS